MLWSSKTFDLSGIPDLTGKTAIVTGSNTGIGRACACELARKNCTVIIAARSEDKSQAAVEEIKAETGNQNIHYIRLDLGSLKNIKEFVNTFMQKHNDLHILLNNAASLFSSFMTTEDGIESQFGINYLGHYYLTILLLPLLTRSAPSRIVNVSSIVHHVVTFTGIDYDALQDKNMCYRKMIVYGKTKAAIVLFTRELAKRLKEKGIDNVYVNSNDPGSVKTDGSRSTVGSLSDWLFVEPKVGALTQIYLATSPEIEEKKITGQYFVPTAKHSKPCGFCRSDENAKVLLDYTEKLLKEKIPDYPGAAL